MLHGWISEIARYIDSARPETSHNKMLPFALAGDSYRGISSLNKYFFQTKKIIKQLQGTFLHQARRAKVQKRGQQETLEETGMLIYWLLLIVFMRGL